MTDRRGATIDGSVSRRKYLLGAGGLAASHLASREVTTRTPDKADRSAAEREDFLWFSEWLWQPDAVRDDLLAFARRHDLSILLAPGTSTRGETDRLRPLLKAAADFDLEVWLRLGIPVDYPVERLVSDDSAMGAHLDRIRDVVGLHAELFDRGKVVLWEEAPVMGQWVEGGAWNEAAVDAMLTHGPELFEAQRRAVRAVADYPVGIFPHFPYVVDSKQPDVFPAVLERLGDRGVDPDFAFTDFYRGWYEKDVGPGPADAAVRSLVANAGDALDGRPVYYLGQAHTVNPQHTPGRQSLRSNLRASLDAGVDGLGWYLRSAYVPTAQGFDPLQPNVPDASFDADPVGTLTVARDRFEYAWQATLASRSTYDPTRRFDCWLVGDEVGFLDLAVWLESPAGEAVFAGHVDAYVPGDYPYAPDRQSVGILRGLRRDRYLGDDLRLRVSPRTTASTGSLDRVLVMPSDPVHYLTEPGAERRLADGPDPAGFSLGAARPERPLAAGTATVSVTVDHPNRTSLRTLRFPDRAATVEHLEAVPVTGQDRFDCWVVGDVGAAAAPALRAGDGSPVPLSSASVVTVQNAEAAVYYGLSRSQFQPSDGLELVDLPADWTVDAVHAMPFAGAACFRTAADAARLWREQPADVATYSLATVER